MCHHGASSNTEFNLECASFQYIIQYVSLCICQMTSYKVNHSNTRGLLGAADLSVGYYRLRVFKTLQIRKDETLFPLLNGDYRPVLLVRKSADSMISYRQIHRRYLLILCQAVLTSLKVQPLEVLNSIQFFFKRKISMASGRLLFCVCFSWDFRHARYTYANTGRHTNRGGAEEEGEEAEKKPGTFLRADSDATDASLRGEAVSFRGRV